MILARFSDAMQAEVAKSTIEEMLASAKGEVTELLERQNGVAEMIDLAEIYSRYGFRNDCGWSYDRAIVANGQDIVWEVPEGMFVEDAQLLLLALGAQFVAVQPDGDQELWAQGPHPAALMLLAEELDLPDLDDDEPSHSAMPEKKVLH